MIFGKNTTSDISKLSQISRAVTNNNFEISLVVFMPNITTNHAITYTNTVEGTKSPKRIHCKSSAIFLKKKIKCFA